MAGSLDFVIRDPMYGTASKTAYTGTAGSVTVNHQAQSVLIWVSTVAYVAIGKTATTGDLPLPANAPIIMPVPNSAQTGSPITVSAIQDSTDRNMYCIAMAE